MEINKLIDNLCESNFDMKKSYDNYFKKVEEIAADIAGSIHDLESQKDWKS